MKKITILLLLFFATIATLAQNDVQKIDSIHLKETNSGNLIFVVYTTIAGGMDEYDVEYDFDEQGNYNVNILYTQINQTDCYCRIPTQVSIVYPPLPKVIISVKVRSKTGGTEENPEFSDYRLIDSKELPFEYKKQIYWIQLQEMTEDSLIYDVFTIVDGKDECIIEYEEGENNIINVNIYFSTIYQYASYFPFITRISIKKDTYTKAIVSVKERWKESGTYEEPIFSDYWLMDSKEIKLSKITGINNPASSYKTVIFPNPAQNVFYVNSGEYKMAYLEIYSLQGNLLLSKNTTPEMGIDVSFLSSGLYFIFVDRKYVDCLIKK